MKAEDRRPRIVNRLNVISKLMSRISSVVLFFMMVLTIADVIGRKVFSHSILGTVELTEFMMLAVVFFGLAHTEVLNGNIKVDLFICRLEKTAQGFVDMVTQFVCFFLCGLLAWATLIYSEQMRASGEVSQDLWLPIYPFIYIVAVGFAVLGLVLLTKFFAAIQIMMRKS